MKYFDCPMYFLFWSLPAVVLRLIFLILFWNGEKRTRTLSYCFFFLLSISTPGRNNSCEPSFLSGSLFNVAAFSDSNFYICQGNILQLTSDKNSLPGKKFILISINYKLSRSVIHYVLLFNQLICWFQWMTIFVASCITLINQIKPPRKDMLIAIKLNSNLEASEKNYIQ